MKHSNYIASKLEIWKDRTTTKLDTLLAKLGIPLEQARQKYMHMKQWCKDALNAKLGDSDELTREFHLDAVKVVGFRKTRKNGMPISAAQCTCISNAMLCLPPSVSASIAATRPLLPSPCSSPLLLLFFLLLFLSSFPSSSSHLFLPPLPLVLVLLLPLPPLLRHLRGDAKHNTLQAAW